MTSLVTIAANPVTALVKDPSAEVAGILAQILSFKVAGAERMTSRAWDGYASLYDRRKNTFPAGFLRLVAKRLELLGYKVIVRRLPAPDPCGPANPVVDSYPEDPRYDYQLQVVERLVNLRGMIAQVATGGGKSRIFKLAQQRLGMPTLFLTTRKSLMYQMVRDYERSFKVSAGIMGDGLWTPRPDGANFAIVDTLASRLEEMTIEAAVEKAVERWHLQIEKAVSAELVRQSLPTDPSIIKRCPATVRAQIKGIRDRIYAANSPDRSEFADQLQSKVDQHNGLRRETIDILKNIGFLCLEEAHEVSHDGYYRISNACSNAHYRLALTATPFMKDDEEANMRLMAVTGPIGIRVSEKTLIERGILATPYFKYLSIPAPAKLRRTDAWAGAYRIGVVENELRNAAIVKECVAAKAYGLTSMVLVQQTKHGDALCELLRKAGLRTEFISGEDQQTERDRCLTALGSGKIDTLIGSTILDVGVDVPSVGMIVLAGAGKAEVNLRQRIGRGLRAKKTGPNVAFIVDFCDPGNRILERHALERRRIVEDTPGFVENIVDQFDFKKAGFRRVK